MSLGLHELMDMGTKSGPHVRKSLPGQAADIEEKPWNRECSLRECGGRKWEGAQETQTYSLVQVPVK
jgi:hypothetical protein